MILDVKDQDDLRLFVRGPRPGFEGDSGGKPRAPFEDPLKHRMDLLGALRRRHVQPDLIQIQWHRTSSFFLVLSPMWGIAQRGLGQKGKRRQEKGEDEESLCLSAALVYNQPSTPGKGGST